MILGAFLISCTKYNPIVRYVIRPDVVPIDYLFDQSRAAIRAAGGRVRQVRGIKLLRVDGTLSLAVTVARYVTSTESFWRVSLRAEPSVGAVLVGLMDRANRSVESLYLIPASRVQKCGKACFTDGGNRMEQYRIDDLDELYLQIRTRALRDAEIIGHPA